MMLIQLDNLITILSILSDWQIITLITINLKLIITGMMLEEEHFNIFKMFILIGEIYLEF